MNERTKVTLRAALAVASRLADHWGATGSGVITLLVDLRSSLEAMSDFSVTDFAVTEPSVGLSETWTDSGGLGRTGPGVFGVSELMAMGMLEVKRSGETFRTGSCLPFSMRRQKLVVLATVSSREKRFGTGELELTAAPATCSDDGTDILGTNLSLQALQILSRRALSSLYRDIAILKELFKRYDHL